MELLSLTFSRLDDQGAGVIAIPEGARQDPPVSDWAITHGTIVRSPVLLFRSTVALCVRVTVAAPDGTWVRASASVRSPLGPARAAQVNGREAILPVDVTRLGAIAVGIYQQTWSWEWSEDGKRGWRRFDEPSSTIHETFVALAPPQPPWGAPAQRNRVVPWRAFIERALSWAGGARSEFAVAQRVTERVFDLGGQMIDDVPIQYNAGGSAFGSGACFAAERLLATIDLKSGADVTMNCADTATAVASFSACLGVPLKIASIKPAGPRWFLVTNRVRPFGEVGGCFQAFVGHQLVVTGLEEQDLCWDACFQLDEDRQPSKAPARWRLSVALPLGANPAQPGSGYFGRLLLNGTPCNLSLGADGGGIRYPSDGGSECPPTSDPYRDRLRSYYRSLLSMACAAEDTGTVSPVERWFESLPACRELWSSGVVVDDMQLTVQHLVWTSPYGRCFIGTVSAPSVAVADNALAELASQFDMPLVVDPSVGSAGLCCLAQPGLLFRRGPVVVRLLNDVTAPTDVHTTALEIDAVLSYGLTR